MNFSNKYDLASGIFVLTLVAGISIFIDINDIANIKLYLTLAYISLLLFVCSNTKYSITYFVTNRLNNINTKTSFFMLVAYLFCIPLLALGLVAGGQNTPLYYFVLGMIMAYQMMIPYKDALVSFYKKEKILDTPTFFKVEN